MKNMIRVAAIGILGLVLAGCGGGGGGGDDDAPSGFTLSGNVSGTPITGQDGETSITVTDSKAIVLSMASGKELVISSTEPVSWTIAPNSTVTATPVKATTDTSWDQTLNSPQGGQLVLTITSKDNPAAVATATITVAPQQFAAVAPVTGHTTNWTENDVYNNGTKQDTTYSRLVTSVAADGSDTVDSLNAQAVVTDHYANDASGNRLSRTYAANNNLCTYTPSREYLSFPLVVGKTWNPAWQYSCAAGYKETATATATAEAWESVTVPAGTFDALRVRIDTTLTNSNDTALLNGNTGQATYSIAVLAWYAPSQGTFVKYQSTYTYNGPAPGSYLATQVQSLAP
jgi:hypothetical protein